MPNMPPPTPVSASIGPRSLRGAVERLTEHVRRVGAERTHVGDPRMSTLGLLAATARRGLER